MKQPEPLHPSVEKVFTLTLMVQESLSLDQIDELEPLLNQRQLALDSLISAVLTDSDKSLLAKAQAVESDILESLSKMQDTSLGSIQGFTKTKTALASYRAVAGSR